MCEVRLSPTGALHDTIRCGGWRPRPSREVLVPKPQGGTRPLAIGCLEDKIVQKLTARILEAIYEPLFHRHSYGFRQDRSAHNALARLHKVIRGKRKSCVVVEMDIEKFFNSDEQTANAFRAHLTERLKEAWLNLNLDKSGMVPFTAKAPVGFVSFLGFDFYWGRNANGERALKLKTSSKKLNRCMKALTDWIKEHRNKKWTKTLWLEAAAKLRGHFNYFGVVFNRPKLAQYYYTCTSSLFRWLKRRSQKRSFTWEKFNRKLWFNPLPKPPSGDELIDSTSEHHSERNHRPKSRMREIRTSGSVRGLSRQWRLRPT